MINWGVCGALVESTPFVRRVMGSTPALYSRHVGTLSKSFTHNCLLRFGVTFRHSIRAVCRERLWVVEDLKRRYRKSLNEMNELCLSWFYWLVVVFVYLRNWGFSLNSSALHCISTILCKWTFRYDYRFCLLKKLHGVTVLLSRWVYMYILRCNWHIFQSIG